MTQNDVARTNDKVITLSENQIYTHARTRVGFYSVYDVESRVFRVKKLIIRTLCYVHLSYNRPSTGRGCVYVILKFKR